ncbi:MAG: CotH kinase family protein [Muribaculaceae bacterium]|nr:CotH kinase family protein [Muribaculaceae bacterium]
MHRGVAADVFDLESVAKYLLLYQITLNNEIGQPKSIYLHKHSLDDGEKYYLGPAWDFDLAFNYMAGESKGFMQNPPDQELWVRGLLNELMNTPEVQSLMKETYRKFEEESLADFREFFDSYSTLIRPSAKLNARRWPEEGGPYTWVHLMTSFDTEKHVGDLRTWLDARFDFLHSKYLTEDPDNPEDPKNPGDNPDNSNSSEGNSDNSDNSDPSDNSNSSEGNSDNSDPSEGNSNPPEITPESSEQ